MAATGNSLGYGFVNPDDSGSQFQAAAAQIKRMLSRLSTMKLVKVTKVTGGAGAIAAPGTVDVQLLVSQIDGNGNKVDHGIVPGIPWARTQGGNAAIIIDPVVGDVGYIVAADRDSSVARGTKDKALPGSRRTYHVSDSVYCSSVLGVAPERYLVFTEDGVRLVDGRGNSIAMAEAGITATDKNGNSFVMASGGTTLTDDNGNTIKTEAVGVTITDLNANQIQTRAGFVNIVTPVLQHNGVPVT